jgi:sorbitol/mannitol transport system permease protein
MPRMATATETPVETSTEAKAAKKKEPKLSFNERWLDKKGWVRRIPLLPALVFIIILTQIPFLATLIISFMNWQANYPNEIFFGTLYN